MEISKNTTVQNIMLDWLEKIEMPHLKPDSYDRKENTCKYQVFPVLGSLPATELTNNDVEGMIQQLLRQGYSYSTIKKSVEAVGGCYRYYRTHGKLTNDPTAGVRIPKGGSSKAVKVRCYNADQLYAIQQESLRLRPDGSRVYPQGDLIIILINTGMRIGELLALNWSDVDLRHRQILICKDSVRIKSRAPSGRTSYIQLIQDTTKSPSGARTIPMNDTAYQAFIRLAKKNGKKGLIARTNTGSPLLHGNIDRTLRRIITNCGFPSTLQYGLHSLRHSFATNLLLRGADIKKVSELLGHSSVKITYDIYVHFIPADYMSTVLMLDELLVTPFT